MLSDSKPATIRFEPWVREPVDRGLPVSQLELHYQPVVRLDGSGVYGAETFLRWRHPERGVLHGGSVVAVCDPVGRGRGAQRRGLAGWAACARRLPGLVLSFNVTGWDLIDEQYVKSILAVADDGAAGLAVEVPYLQFHPKVARARARVGLARARRPRRGPGLAASARFQRVARRLRLRRHR